MSEWVYETEQPIRGSQLLAAFFAAFPETAALARVTRLAVNQAFCADDPQLASSDEIALIPPVSGG